MMKSLLINKWTHIGLLLIFLITTIFYSASENDLRKRFQYFVFDNYNKIYEREALDEIIVVDIDENALRKIGQWPWPRDIMAQLVDNLTLMGAKSIAFDVVFAENDRTSPSELVKRLPQNEDYQNTREQIILLPDNDSVFAKAIQSSSRVVTGFTSAKKDETRRLPHQPVPPTLLLKDKKIILDNVYQTRGVATNLENISQSASGNGHFMVTPNTDGLIRDISLFSRYYSPNQSTQLNTLYPNLSLEALRVSMNPKMRMIVKEKKNKSLFDMNYEIKLGDFTIPMDKNSKFWVHYRKINKEKEYISALDILENKKSEIVKNKIIFIGTSAEGLRDIRSTSLEQFVPGVEVHVNIIEQIMQGRFLQRPEFIAGMEAVIIGIMGLLIIFLTPFSSIFILGALTFISIGLMSFGSWYGYVHQGLLIDPVYPSFVLFSIYILATFLKYLRLEADRKQVKEAFGHYISPAFMEELTNNPDKLKLGGEIKELTVMFTDIRSFTKISESLSPEELIQLMNDFLTPMSDLVMQSRGTIDKYMGDAMMAFWNAPLDDSEHARQACLTALKMKEALEPINKELELRASDGEKPLKLSAGIGVNTGLCSVGNMGSKQRFAYSALGDAVNLASRLEGQTKSYGVDCLVGENTAKQVKDLAFLELDLIQVVGKDTAVKIYTLIGDWEYKKSNEFKKWEAAHNSMLAAYRIADFDCAAQDCKEAKEFSDGKLEAYYKLYMQRIIAYTKAPPPDDWSGVFVAKSK